MKLNFKLKSIVDNLNRYLQNACKEKIDFSPSVNKHLYLSDQPQEFNSLRGGMPGIIGDCKYFLNIRKIIKSNRSFFFDFYFKSHLPETIKALTNTGEWKKKLECINDAHATKSNLLESIDQAITLAQGSIESPLLRMLAVRALRQESAIYAAINVVDSSCF